MMNTSGFGNINLGENQSFEKSQHQKDYYPEE
jgi:hypothetical protein